MASRFRALFEIVWPPLPVWKRLDAAVLLVVAYTAGVQFIVLSMGIGMPKWIGEMGVVNALILGVLLSFRNVQAYERWWEGRKLWGQLINDSRNLCLKAVAYGPADAEQRRAFGRAVAGFAVALKNHLRGRKDIRLVPGFEAETATPAHVPAYLAGLVFGFLRDWRAAGTLREFEFLTIDSHAKALMDIAGACERILSSPVPLSYRALLRHGTLLYLVTAPWFLTGENQFGYWSIAVMALMSYFLLGIEFTAEDVEEPFGKDGDDLELGRYCETIRASVEQILEVPLGLADLSKTVGEVRVAG